MDRLRAAAGGILDADSHAGLGAAATDLAVAAMALGPDRWPRFVGTAARTAEAAVSNGEVPGARLIQAAMPGTVSAAPGGWGIPASGAVLAPLGRVLIPLLTAAPPVAGIVTLVAWVKKYGTVTNVPVQGFGPDDRGVTPVSAEVNAGAGTVRLYHGPTTRPPDTATQHTVELRIGADGVLTGRDGRAVGRLDAGRRIVPMPGMDIPGLFHGPAATPPGGQVPGKALPPAPGTSATSDADRKVLGRPETLPAASPTPGVTGTPAPAPLPAQPGRDIAPALPDIYEAREDTTLTSPTGIAGGPASGRPFTTPENAKSSQKASVDSEIRMSKAMRNAGYRVIENPTEGPNPALTPEGLEARGLVRGKNPDYLVEDRVYDEYTGIEQCEQHP